MASPAEKKHQKLKEIIRQHDHNYYVLDQPQISDYEYDQLFAELQELEKSHPELSTADSPTHRVGGVALDVFKKVPHRRQMLSLANSYSPDDLLEFDERVKKFLNSQDDIEYFCELKFDGLAIELIYEKGQLVRALTRGDGSTGEDVTQNIKTIKAIPLVLNSKSPPTLLEVRGEILLFKSDFLKLNEMQQENGDNVFANPRNAAAGTVRQLDRRIRWIALFFARRS
jgi:DNA ligase (NAD+)